jgi:hypothetical protein
MPRSTPTTESHRPAATVSRPPRRRRGRWILAVAGVGALGLAAYAWTVGHVADVVIAERCSATTGGRSTVLSPERMGNAAIIAGISVKRGLPARAASIGLATAMQESKLENLDYGDRDSLGLFQQRPSQGWGTPDQVRDPVYATNAFYDVLVKVEGYRNLEITKAAQKVQRSGYPDAYADHEDDARALASSLTGHTEAGLTCVLKPVESSAGEPPPRGKDGLIAPARAVAVAAGGEAAGQLQGPAGDSGRFLRFGSDGDPRRGWSLAQWAVARAAGLDIVAVATDGQRWDRNDPGEGWQAFSGDLPGGGRLGAGEVLIEVT